VRRTLPLLAAFILAASGLFASAGLGRPGRADAPVRVYLGEPSTLDPAATGDAGSAGIIAQLFEGLTAIDGNLVTRPALAETWELFDGGRRIVFTLRDGLAFSDGSPLTADDVVRSWLRVIAPAAPSPLASLLYDVEGVPAYVRGESTDPSTVGLHAPDARHLEVRLTRPAADFPAVAASPTLAVVPAGVGRDASALQPGLGFVASGGYVLQARTETALELTANGHYWAGTPAIGNVEIATSISGKSPVDAFSAGELDWTGIASWDASWIRYDPDFGPALRQGTDLAISYYGFDVRRPPFDDARVRRAFAQAVDWRRIVALAGGSDTIAATGMVPPGIPGRSDEDFVPAFDPAAARELLRQAGFASGSDFPDVTIVTSGTGYDAAVVAQLKANLGVDVRYEEMDFDEYFPRLSSDPPQVWAISWIADYPSPNDFLGILLGSDQPNNYGGWSSAAFDAAIARAVGTSDAATSRAAYEEAERIVRDEVPVVPISSGTGYTLVRSGLMGARENGLGILRLAGLAWGSGR